MASRTTPLVNNQRGPNTLGGQPVTFDDNSFEGRVLKSLTRIEERMRDLPDHERRLRWLERAAYILVGAWTFLAVWLKVHIMGGGK